MQDVLDSFYAALRKGSAEDLARLVTPDCSVVVLEGHWKVPATGVEVRAKAANVFTFAGRRIASYGVLNDTAAFVEALAGPRATGPRAA